MAVFNGNAAFAAKRRKSQPVAACPKNVKQSLNIAKAYQNGTFKIEPKSRQAIYDRCYLFEDINSINKNKAEQKDFLLDFMLWLNSMDVEFKITLANEYQDMEEFLGSVRSEKNGDQYPDIVEGIRQWQQQNIEEVNPNVTTLRYLTVTSQADSEEEARVYLNALENTIFEAFAGWGSRIVKLDGESRLEVLQAIIQPGRPEEREYISRPKGEGPGRDWKNDILPRESNAYKNFMIMGDAYVSVLFGGKYRRAIDSDTLIRSLSNTPYPSVLTMDFAPIETDVVNDKLVAAQMNNDRAITDELEQKRNAGMLVTGPSYTKEKKKQEIEDYIDQVDENDEKGFFLNLLLILTAPSEEVLAERVNQMQAVGRKEGCMLETCNYRQLKAWNTALPIGGRQVDYMRFFLTSSLVAFQPYHAQDIIEPGGQMMGMNKTTKRYILGNRKKLPNPHGIIVGYTGSGKSMLVKLTELSQTLLGTDDDILVIDPQNEFENICKMYQGAYFDLTPKSGVYLNGFEVTKEVFEASEKIKLKFIAAQTEYAKSFCAATMKNIEVTQEHDAIVSRCTEQMYQTVFAQRRLKRQPDLIWLREEIGGVLKEADNAHDEENIRQVYNCLEEYTYGSCDMFAHPTNIRFDSCRLVGFGMANVPTNNWEAAMVTVLHYLSTRMEYNKILQRATHLIVDESQVVSKKPGSANQLNNAVITFRKFGGIVTMVMQNVTAALSNQVLTETFSNCSYKCFLDQGGVDAQSLAAIQEFSAKEYRALGQGSSGEGVIVWNKKVVLFDAKIRKDNVLYKPYDTNFHEQAEKAARAAMEGGTGPMEEGPGAMEEAAPDAQEGTGKACSLEKYYEQALQLAEVAAISSQDIMQVLQLSGEESQALLEDMLAKGLLAPAQGAGKYRKAAA